MTLADRLRAALAAGLARNPLLLAGDPRITPLQPGEVLVPAAVLVAVTDRPNPGVILTQRPAHMRRHPGQVAFPGGRLDPGDDGPVAGALREAEEEIGLPRDRVEVIGTTDFYQTITGYQVTPVIGVIPPDLPLVPQEAEVADLFEVPLALLMAQNNYALRTVEWQGGERQYFELFWGERRIWGATAAMLVNLARRLEWTA